MDDAADFGHLPGIVLGRIFRHVGRERKECTRKRAFRSLRATCKNWRDVFDHQLDTLKPNRFGGVHVLVQLAAQRFENLTHLDLSDCTVAGRNELDALRTATITSLRKLVLPTNLPARPVDTFLTCFENLMGPQLATVEVRGGNAGNADADYALAGNTLRALPHSLTCLNMGYSRTCVGIDIGAGGLVPYLSGLTSLCYLSINLFSEDLGAIRHALESMSTLTNLRHLAFRKKFTNSHNFAPIEKLDVFALSGLSALRQLASLDLTNTINARSWEGFSALNQLTSLTLAHCNNAHALGDVGQTIPPDCCIISLRELDISECSLTQEVLVTLCQLTFLTCLRMNSCMVVGEEGREINSDFLKGLDQLQHLEMGNICRIYGEGFAVLSELRHLNLAYVPNAQDVVLALPNPTTLEYLDLGVERGITLKLRALSVSQKMEFFEHLRNGLNEARNFVLSFGAWSESDDEEYIERQVQSMHAFSYYIFWSIVETVGTQGNAGRYRKVAYNEPMPLYPCITASS